MNVRRLPKSQVEITICVPAANLEKFIDIAAQELSRDIKIPGFRPGKAPRKVVEQKVGSEKLLAHGAEKAVKQYYVDSIAKNEVEAVGEPEITITKIASGNDLEFKAVVGVVPEITLGDYKKQAGSVKREAVKKIEQSRLEKELEYLRKSRAKLVTVLRKAKVGDRVEIDFRILIENKEISGGTGKSHPVVIGENFFIPGFEEMLVGMEEGEEKKFDLSFPTNYHEKNLAGKKATFEVKMGLVQERQLPEINDEFARNLGKFDNLEKLKGSISEGLHNEQEKKNEEKWRQEILDSIISETVFDLPDILIDRELQKMTQEFEQSIVSMGMKLDDYLLNIKKTREDLLREWRAPAEKRAKSSLVLREIAKLEEISPKSSEVEAEMNKTIAYFKGQGDLEKNIDMESLYNYVKGVLTNEKVFKFLEDTSGK